MKVTYTGYFVDDIPKLLHEVPVVLQGKTVKVYAHHVTREYKPPHGLNGLHPGARHILYGFAEVVTDRIQVLLVRDRDAVLPSANPHPHITIATAKGAAAVESNSAIEQAYKDDSIRTLPQEIEISVTEGYFDGQSVHKD